MFMIGIDPHKGSHTATAVDAGEVVVGEVRVVADRHQRARLLAWAAAFEPRSWAIEGATGMGAMLAQQLLGAGEHVVDVPPKLSARVRLMDTGRIDESDPNDARSAAIVALRNATLNTVTGEREDSSRGPATYCWGPVVGTTPAAPLPSCQSKQVDISATDGGQNSFFGGSGPPFRFFGTSAAAPHAAAVAALQLDRAPGITPSQVMAAQAASARAVGSFGPSAVGAGLLDAVAAVAPPQAISWTIPPPGSVVAGTSFPVAAAATSGLPVSIAASGQCIGGGTSPATIIATGAGSCTVVADQAGNSQWLPAPPLAALVQVVAVPVVPPVAPVGYVPTSPARLLDSRPGSVTFDGQGAGIGVRPASSTTELQVTGRAGVPTDAGAAVLNVTVTEPEGAGFVTVWPCGEPRPLASNLNYTAGANIPNNVIVKIGAGGKVCLFTLAGTHLIADLNGFYPAGATYTPTSPARLLDSRPGSVTFDGQGAGIGVRPASSTTELQVTGRAGVPTDAGAAVLNVTVTEPEGAGFVTVWPCGEPRPLASNLNYTAGANIPNNVIVKIGAGGKVCLFTLAGTHLIADLNGWMPTS